jgi:hypothetical protein
VAQIVNKLSFRFHLASRGDSKRLRGFLFERGHTHTSRTDIDFDAAIFYAPEEQSIVTPFLYGAKAIQGVLLNLDLDRQWIARYKSLPPSFPKIGIGRGAQFLNVMSGGATWQIVEGHDTASQSHDLKLYESGELIQVPSNHKASMQAGYGCAVIGAANAAVKLVDHDTTYMNPNDWMDEEIIYYEHNNSLCLEPHPEKLGFKAYSNFAMELIEKQVVASQ